MSAGEEATEPEAVEVEPAGEPRQMSERTAKAILLVIAVGALWGIVAAAPWVAYVVVGILLDRGWLKAREWTGRRRGSSEVDADELADEAPVETLAETLHRLANPHVFLADFAEARGLSKAEARDALEMFGMTVRRAVRNGDTTGVGVHREDLPPLPHPSRETPETRVDQGQPTNQQALSVEEIGLAGRIVKDGSEAGRRHRI